MTAIGTVRADLAAGFGLLTRVPVGWLAPDSSPYRPGRAVWCYPLVGALLGAGTAGGLLGAGALGLPPLLGAGWTLVLAVLLTGGLHEDGLADLADGSGGGRTPERRLEIMRDSRIGAFGALALVLSLGLRLAALDRLSLMPPLRVLEWAVASLALSRMAMLPVLLLPAARPDGLGRSLGRIARPTLLAALSIGAALAFLLLDWRQAIAMIAASQLVGMGLARFVRIRLGGRTGDALGATVVVAECVLLTIAVSV